jgi:hypothetical protein
MYITSNCSWLVAKKISAEEQIAIMLAFNTLKLAVVISKSDSCCST